MARAPSRRVRIGRYEGGSWSAAGDDIAAEEPLQLLLDGEPLSVIMRTPGSDIELALGLLHAERVITSLDDVAGLRISAEAGEREERVTVASDLLESNAVDVHLATTAARRPRRSFLSSSACGVCGATTLDDLAHDHPPLAPGPVVDAAVLPPLAERLRERQRLFDLTGGLHAAGLFTSGGELVTLREDIGRHNAVDKVVGRAVLDRRVPLAGTILVVSGRGGYELVQKAVAAGIPMLVAVGAPSSLAVATAVRFGLTLVGFLRGESFNVYSGPERIRARGTGEPGTS
ncbi:MAG TPA: formate dehydrogenase accessory sulfurtransferase FdhD [Candidatus Limnocylindria bacterium]|nr:formate dehydrogenase accessory sulfurtransferase FdhD [Candidatus Limnocylindria bacterium]